MAFVHIVKAAPRWVLLLAWLVSASGFSAPAAGEGVPDPAASLLSKVQSVGGHLWFGDRLCCDVLCETSQTQINSLPPCMTCNGAPADDVVCPMQSQPSASVSTAKALAAIMNGTLLAGQTLPQVRQGRK